MLSKEMKAHLVNMANDAETYEFCDEIMDVIINLLLNKKEKTRSEILYFLRSIQGAPFLLYCELMRYYTSTSNKPTVSFKI